MFEPLLHLSQLELLLFLLKDRVLELLLVLLVLFLVVSILQVELLLELVDFDLQLNAAFAFAIIGLEQVQLQGVVLLSQILALVSQVTFYLLTLEQLNFKLADFLLKQGNPLVEEILRAEAVLCLLAKLKRVPLLDFLLQLLDVLGLVRLLLRSFLIQTLNLPR